MSQLVSWPFWGSSLGQPPRQATTDDSEAEPLVDRVSGDGGQEPRDCGSAIQSFESGRGCDGSTIAPATMLGWRSDVEDSDGRISRGQRDSRGDPSSGDLSHERAKSSCASEELHDGVGCLRRHLEPGREKVLVDGLFALGQQPHGQPVDLCCLPQGRRIIKHHQGHFLVGEHAQFFRCLRERTTQRWADLQTEREAGLRDFHQQSPHLLYVDIMAKDVHTVHRRCRDLADEGDYSVPQSPPVFLGCVCDQLPP